MSYLGHPTRKDYVKALADDYGVPHDIALLAAQMLGESEDADGLITTLEDYSLEHPDECE